MPSQFGSSSGLGGGSPLAGLGLGSMSSIGGGAPGMGASSLQGMGVASSTLMLMSQIGMMMASVMTGLMAFMQTVMASAAQRQQTGGLTGDPTTGGGTPGGGNPGGGSSIAGPTSGGSPNAQSVISWARAEKAKGIDEAGDQSYISKNYSQGGNRAWCADFVSTAMEQNGGSPWGHQAAVQGILDWAKSHNSFYPSQVNGGNSQPNVGDVILFKQGGMSHTAIVTKVEGGKVFTIGGNESDTIKEQSYSLGDNRITGYVDMARARQAR